MKNKKPAKTTSSFLDFAEFTKTVSDAVGQFWSFMLALLFVVIWLISGPFFGFSDTWQLIINTATTIITFLMVFLIQHTQNRDIEILNLKIDELIKSHKSARNTSINLNSLSDEELEKLEKTYNKIRNKRTGS